MVYNNAKYKNILIINSDTYNFAKSRFNEVVWCFINLKYNAL